MARLGKHLFYLCSHRISLPELDHPPFVTRTASITLNTIYSFSLTLLRNAKRTHRNATMLWERLQQNSSLHSVIFPFNFSRLCAGLRIVYGAVVILVRISSKYRDKFCEYIMCIVYCSTVYLSCELENLVQTFHVAIKIRVTSLYLCRARLVQRNYVHIRFMLAYISMCNVHIGIILIDVFTDFVNLYI